MVVVLKVSAHSQNGISLVPRMVSTWSQNGVKPTQNGCSTVLEWFQSSRRVMSTQSSELRKPQPQIVATLDPEFCQPCLS